MTRFKDKTQKEVIELFNKRFVYKDEKHIYSREALVIDLLRFAVEDDLMIDPAFTYNEMVLDSMNEVCAKISDAIGEDFKSRGTFTIKKHLISTMRFCFYASAAAVLLCETEPMKLFQKGIFETLTEPRGIYYMDEYCSDVMGKPWRSDDAEDVLKISMHYAYMMACAVAAKWDYSLEIARDQFRQCMHAMYMLGMVYGRFVPIEKELIEAAM